MTWQQFVLLLLIWLWRHWMNPDLLPLLPKLPNVNPVELIDAAKAVAETARKWGQVADAVLSWNMPVAFALGAFAGIILFSLLRKKA